MPQRSGVVAALHALLFVILVAPVRGQTVVYSNQNDIANIGIGFSPSPVIWDDLLPTRGGTLSEISLTAWHTDSNVRAASGFIDLRVFDEQNNRPQGASIGVIPFNATFSPDPNDSTFTVIALDNLESLGLTLPGSGRIGVGILFDNDDWLLPDPSVPTIGSSPGGNWLDNSSLERNDGVGDFAWRLVVAETAPLVIWNAGSGPWSNSDNWDSGFTPKPSQDVRVRSSGGVAVVDGPASDTTVASVQVGELAFFNTTLRLQPGTTLTADESFLVATNGYLDVNGGRIVTGDFQGPITTFDGGTIEVHGGEFFPTPLDFTLSGTGNPTVILDDARFDVGFGENHEDLLVADGIDHSASLTARDGTILTAENAVIGGQRGTHGELILSGSGTTIDVFTKLTLGQNAPTNNDPAHGTLLVEDQAVVTVAEVDIGQAGFGEATVDHATLNVVENLSNEMSGELRIGGLAPSSLTIRNGGVVNAQFVDIASSIATTASLVVTGNGSQLNAPGGIAVGDSNEGKIHVLDGAHVTTGTLATGFGAGLGPNEKNEIEINGALTHVDVAGFLQTSAGGEISIDGGAQVTANAAAVFGGSITVAGQDTLLDTSFSTSTVSSLSALSGSLVIRDGALVRSRGLEVGRSGTATNSAVVTGAGSRLVSEDLFFIVGNLAPALLEISAGAVVERTGDVFVAASNSAPADLNILGAGSRWEVDGDVYLSGARLNGDVFSFNAVSTLNIQDGATADIDGTLEPFTKGQINLQGGTLVADEITLQSGGQFNFTGGRLAVENFDGDLENDGGTLVPGQSAGIANVSGRFGQSNGALEVEIFNGGLLPVPGVDYDQLLADSVELGGALVILVDDDYQPALGDSFKIIQAASSLSEQFDSILGADLGDGLAFDVLVDLLAHSVTLEVVESQILAGDFSGNGAVENADLTLLLNSWAEAVPPTPMEWIGSPLTAPAVDNDELTALLNNWGVTSGTGGQAASAVPEPATRWCFILGAAIMWSLLQQPAPIDRYASRTFLASTKS